MATVRHTYTNFTGGELDPKLKRRVDLEVYQRGLKRAKNVVIQPQGGLRVRPGFRFQAATGNDRCERLLKFEFNADDRYTLAFRDHDADSTAYVYRDGVQVATFVLPSSGGAYSKWDQLGDTLIRVSPLAAPIRITRGATHADWSAEELVLANVPQHDFGDVIAHRDFPLDAANANGRGFTVNGTGFWALDRADRKVYAYNLDGTRAAARDFPLDAANADGRGFTVNGTGFWILDQTDLKVYAYNLDGTRAAARDFPLDAANANGEGITVNGTGFWVLDWVDRKVYAYNLDGTRAAARDFPLDAASAYGGGITVNGTGFWVLDWVDRKVYAYGLQTGSRTTDPGLMENVWSDARGWPSTVLFYEGRLYFGGSKSRPTTIWGSKVGDYFNFEKTDDAFDDEAVEASMGGAENDRITSLVNVRSLVVLTTGGEHIIPQSQGDPITPSNFHISRQTPYGSEGIDPVDFGGAILFPQYEKPAIREFIYTETEAAYVANLITLLSGHLIEPGVVSMRFQVGGTEEDGDRLYVTNGDGHLIVYTILRNEQIVAASDWVFSVVNTQILDTVVLGDEVYALVQRGQAEPTALVKLDPDYGSDHNGANYTVVKMDVETMPFETNPGSGLSVGNMKRIVETVLAGSGDSLITVKMNEDNIGEVKNWDDAIDGALQFDGGMGYTREATVTLVGEGGPVTIDAISVKVSVGQ